MFWRIYYDSGRTFSSADGTPFEAPAIGVVAIQQRTNCTHHPAEIFKTNERRLSGEDWYWWRDDIGWLQGTHDGMLDQVMNCAAKYVKQGRMVEHTRWEQIWTTIANDFDFR